MEQNRVQKQTLLLTQKCRVNWFLIRYQINSLRENIRWFWSLYGKKNYFNPLIHAKLKLINLNVSTNIAKLQLKENLCDIELGKDFLNGTESTETLEGKKIIKWTT